MADAARAAKDATQKARAEQGRLKDAAERAVRDAANAADKFKDFTVKLVKVEVDKLTKEDLDKQSADELAEETKMLDLADAIAAAKKAPTDQAPEIEKAVAVSAEADKVAKAAYEAAKAADKAIADAKAALASANAIDARKDNPVSIFVSRKTGRLSVKLGMGDPVIDVPVTITNPNMPLGTHVFTAVGYTPGEKSMRWNVVTVNTSSAAREKPYRRRNRHDDEAYVAPAGDNPDPANALERIQIPKDTMDRLAELVKPGSSFIITDYGLSRGQASAPTSSSSRGAAARQRRSNTRGAARPTRRASTCRQKKGAMARAVAHFVFPRRSTRQAHRALGRRNEYRHGISDRHAPALEHPTRDAAAPLRIERAHEALARFVHALARRRRVGDLEHGGAIGTMPPSARGSSTPSTRRFARRAVHARSAALPDFASSASAASQASRASNVTPRRGNFLPL